MIIGTGSAHPKTFNYLKFAGWGLCIGVDRRLHVRPECGFYQSVTDKSYGQLMFPRCEISYSATERMGLLPSCTAASIVGSPIAQQCGPDS